MQIDFTKLFVLILAAILCYRLKKAHKSTPCTLPVSSLSFFSQGKSLKMRLAFLSRPLFWSALFFLGLAFTNPRISTANHEAQTSVKKTLPRKGLAIYLL